MRTILTPGLKEVHNNLTTQELEVLHLMSFDYNIDEVVLELICSHAEVEEVIKSVYAKMQVETTVEDYLNSRVSG